MINVLAGIPLVGDLVKTIFGSSEERDQYQASARSDVYKQFAAEFGHGKTWWDSLIDGLNRLPRPVMTFGTIYIFWLCWTDPTKFLDGAVALQSMPKEGWYILGAIVTFWFAAKLPKDFGKYKAAPSIPVYTKESSTKYKTGGGADPQEGIEWKDRVANRYNE